MLSTPFRADFYNITNFNIPVNIFLNLFYKNIKYLLVDV
ncbi:hypothetical protein CULT_2810003 [[Clostridium] ultunense Esp]|nr:hypothetical protein CULT_2810003 [[Clostridium] ultunense Esp]